MSSLERTAACGLRLLGALALGGVAAVVAAAGLAGAPPGVQRVESGGIAVDLTLRPVDPKQGALQAGEQVEVVLRVSDARTGDPLINLHPRVWMSLRREGNERPGAANAPLDAERCQRLIAGFASGALPQRADVDLNAFSVLTLNTDRTLTFINPQVNVKGTQLESIIVLPSVGMDWAITPDRDGLYVSMPSGSAIAQIDLRSRKLKSTIDTGRGTAPTRIAMQPDGRRVWTGLDGSDQVVVINTATHAIERRLTVQSGRHAFAFSADGRHAFVSNTAADSVTVIDAQKLEVLAHVPVGATPLAMAWGNASQTLYVGALNGEVVSVIDPQQRRVVRQIPTDRGVAQLQFEPLGRHALVLNRLQHTLTVIDSANHSVVGRVAVVREPDQIQFSQRYAYVRGLGSEKFSLLELAALRKGEARAVDIAAGRSAPSTADDELGVASIIAPLPDGDAVLVANAREQVLYLFQEGMMATTGTLQNYKRVPLGAMVIDRSLHEIAPGTYATTAKLAKGGLMDVSLLIGTPRLSHCFGVAVSPQAAGTTTGTAMPRIEPAFDASAVQAGSATPLRVRMIDGTTQAPLAGLKDLRVLVFAPPGTWQRRHVAVEVEAGVYQFEEAFPAGGRYLLSLSSLTAGLRASDWPALEIDVRSQARPLTNATDRRSQ